MNHTNHRSHRFSPSKVKQVQPTWDKPVYLDYGLEVGYYVSSRVYRIECEMFSPFNCTMWFFCGIFGGVWDLQKVEVHKGLFCWRNIWLGNSWWCWGVSSGFLMSQRGMVSIVLIDFQNSGLAFKKKNERKNEILLECVALTWYIPILLQILRFWALIHLTRMNLNSIEHIFILSTLQYYL